MKIFYEKSLSDFEWWSGVRENAKMFTSDELEELESYIEDLYPDGIDETKLNDIMLFDYEWIAEVLGLELNKDGEVKRDEDDEDDEEDE